MKNPSAEGLFLSLRENRDQQIAGEEVQVPLLSQVTWPDAATVGVIT